MPTQGPGKVPSAGTPSPKFFIYQKPGYPGWMAHIRDIATTTLCAIASPDGVLTCCREIGHLGHCAAFNHSGDLMAEWSNPCPAGTPPSAGAGLTNVNHRSEFESSEITEYDTLLEDARCDDEENGMLTIEQLDAMDHARLKRGGR